MAAVKRLEEDLSQVTHLIVTSCTGMYAPGLDLELVQRLGLSTDVERTMIGFMGCYAAINALKLSHHIVRSVPSARVLLVNLELSSLHMQETANIEKLLSFLVFADGCAASLVSAEPRGLAIEGFLSEVIPNTAEQITWHVRDQGFEMHLSGLVPKSIHSNLGPVVRRLQAKLGTEQPSVWAVHPGGRSVLDAVQAGLQLAPDALDASRDILARFGNMSSATVMFVLASVMQQAPAEALGCAMSFGPGATAETMLFRKAATC
jgi:alpha-pyrone synthase